ncbi:hypothetical protein ACLESO_53870 [Pyxidicoccus sp. 3LG]
MDVKGTMPGRSSVGRLSLRIKILAVTGVTGVLVAGILILAFWLQMGSAQREDLTRRSRSVSTELAKTLTPMVSARGDPGRLQAAAHGVLRHVPDVAYVLVRDGKGDLVAEVAAERFAGEDQPAPEGDEVVDRRLTLNGLGVVEVTTPIFASTAAQGARAPAAGARCRWRSTRRPWPTRWAAPPGSRWCWASSSCRAVCWRPG